MAFDTVIDKAKLEGAMTASANAIREKTGDTALIEWLQDTGFAEAIAAIEAGGGGMSTGYFTIGDDVTSDIVITHGLGVKPYYLAVVLANNKQSSYTTSKQPVMGYIFAIQYYSGTDKQYGLKWQSPNGSSVSYSTGSVSASDTSAVSGYYRIGIGTNDFTLRQSNINSSVGMGAGATYYWIAIAEGTLQ